MIVLTQFVYLCQILSNEEEGLLSVKLLRVVYKREKEQVIVLSLVVHLKINLLLHMLMLDSDVVVLLLMS